MNTILLLARLILAAVLAVAGAAKLADPAGTRKALASFGAPNWAAERLWLVLPLAEITIAALLLPASSAWIGAMAALALLAVFLAAIVINLSQGRTPDCNCFGQIHSAPVGASTLALNGALIALAGLIAWKGVAGAGPGAFDWLADASFTERVALGGAAVGVLLLAVIAALLWQVLTQQGRLLLRLDSLEALLGGSQAPIVPEMPSFDPLASGVGLSAGTAAPHFNLDAVAGGTVGLDALLSAGKKLVLLFASPSCGPCVALLPQIARWQKDHSESLSFAVISEGSLADNKEKYADGNVGPVLLQRGREVAESYQAWGTPAALVVEPDGRIGSQVAQGADKIAALVAWAAVSAAGDQGAGAGQIAALQPGDEVPDIKLRDVNGSLRTVTALRNRDTLLLFWNPSCGFCQSMLDHLRAWDADRPAGAPELLVISSGAAAANKAMELSAPVLTDEPFEVAPVFGAGGTPMAVLLDGKGRVASSVAAGADAVLALANGAQAKGKAVQAG